MLHGPAHDCGRLLELAQIQRRFGLGSPVDEGVATIPVAHIIGSVGRAQDFDGCFRPLRPNLVKRLREITESDLARVDSPIDVVRVDRAYFVADGHKRVALARADGRAFIDANVRRVQSPYVLTSEVESDAIERTAREAEFRRHTGLEEALPHVRFPLTDVTAYGEIRQALLAFAYERARGLGRLPSAAELARTWYEEVYLPTVNDGRRTVGALIDGFTDADVFVAMHRLRRASWGTECDDPECVADMLLVERQRARARETFAKVIRRVRGAEPHPSVLPLAGATPDAPDTGLR